MDYNNLTKVALNRKRKQWIKKYLKEKKIDTQDIRLLFEMKCLNLILNFKDQQRSNVFNKDKTRNSLGIQNLMEQLRMLKLEFNRKTGQEICIKSLLDEFRIKL